MKIKENFSLRVLGDQNFIVDNHQDRINMVNVYKLSESAAWLWTMIADREFTEDILVEWLCHRYEVDSKNAFEDVNTLLKDWKKRGLVE